LPFFKPYSQGDFEHWHGYRVQAWRAFQRHPRRGMDSLIEFDAGLAKLGPYDLAPDC
jgi:hypothetical protein